MSVEDITLDDVTPEIAGPPKHDVLPEHEIDTSTFDAIVSSLLKSDFERQDEGHELISSGPWNTEKFGGEDGSRVATHPGVSWCDNPILCECREHIRKCAGVVREEGYSLVRAPRSSRRRTSCT